MTNYWSDADTHTLIEERKKGKSVKFICNLLGRSESAVRTKLCSLGITVISPNWNEKEDWLLIDNYRECNYEEMENLIKTRSRKQIAHRAKQLGVKKSKGSISDSLRKSHIVYPIDVSCITDNMTSDGAAILGFILADGTVYHKKNVIKITIHTKDVEYLHKIKSILKYEKRIKKFPSSPNSVTLNINSKRLIEFMLDNVKYINKSVDLQYPEFIKGSPLEGDFMRGLFEGDGSIRYASSRDYYTFSFTGTKSVCDGFGDSLLKMGVPRNRKLYKDKRTAVDVYYLEYGEKELIEIGNVMYKSVLNGNSSLFMERKLDRFRRLWRKYGLW